MFFYVNSGYFWVVWYFYYFFLLKLMSMNKINSCTHTVLVSKRALGLQWLFIYCLSLRVSLSTWSWAKWCEYGTIHDPSQEHSCPVGTDHRTSLLRHKREGLLFLLLMHEWTLPRSARYRWKTECNGIQASTDPPHLCVGAADPSCVCVMLGLPH